MRNAASMSLQHLVEAYPDEPAAELARFAAARPGKPADALKLYKRYRKWRREDGAADALGAVAQPAEARDAQFAALGGRVGEFPVLLVEGARYALDVPAEAYVALLCRRMDEALASDASTRLVVLIDARAGTGWPNPSALKLVGFLRLCASAIPNRYPERLRRVVVYPLPGWAKTLIGLVTRLLEPVTRDKIEVLAGSDSKDAPCPAGLAEHVALDAIPEHARARHAALAPEDAAAPEDVVPEDAVR